MPTKTTLCLALLLISRALVAQDSTCNCLENLNKLILKTEENYAGYPVKVNTNTKPTYNKLVQTLRAKTLNLTDPQRCFYLLKEYVRFFKDKHFTLSYYNPKGSDNEKIAYSQTYFDKAIAQKTLRPLEGIWVNAEGSLKLAIQKAPNNIYKAIVVESKNPNEFAGLVYLTLTPSKNGYVAKQYDYSITTDTPAKQRGNLLQIWNQQLFGKIYPEHVTPVEQAELSTWRDNNNGLAFRSLSPKTTYLKIPTFGNNDDRIQALISKNDSIIRHTDYLIVDLTGNGGGSTGWVYLLPYLMTKAIVQYDTYLRVTPENVKSKLKDLEFYVNNPIPDEYKKYFPAEILAAYQKVYRELPNTARQFYPIPGVTFPLDSILAKPRKVALIVDDLCGSSTEFFFSLTKQSAKTLRYGINTIGMMDYEGMSNPTALPYDKYILMIPIVKSSWTDTKPIDKQGFAPDVLLDKIKPQHWIEYVRKDLESK